MSDNNKSNQLNPNRGTNGTNSQYSKAMGNRGKQLNSKPNNSNGGKPNGKK